MDSYGCTKVIMPPTEAHAAYRPLLLTSKYTLTTCCRVPLPSSLFADDATCHSETHLQQASLAKQLDMCSRWCGFRQLPSDLHFETNPKVSFSRNDVFDNLAINISILAHVYTVS